MSNQPEDGMDLDELEDLLAASPKPLRELFTTAINIYADPLQNTESDAQRRDRLRQAIEQSPLGRKD